MDTSYGTAIVYRGILSRSRSCRQRQTEVSLHAFILRGRQQGNRRKLEADSLEDLEKKAKKLNNNNDDISRAFFFHLQSFSSKTDETKVTAYSGKVDDGLKQASKAYL